MRIEGKIVGFDEFMNIVMTEAVEVYTPLAKGDKPGKTKELGRILLKGDNIVSNGQVLRVSSVLARHTLTCTCCFPPPLQTLIQPAT